MTTPPRQPFIDDSDGNRIPEYELRGAVESANPQATPAQTRLATLFADITDDYLQRNPGHTGYDAAVHMTEPFKVKAGKEEGLDALFQGFQSQLSRTGTPNGVEAISRKAILWAHQVQVETKEHAGDTAPPTTAEIASATYDKVFAKGEIAKIRRPLTQFIKEYWDGDTATLETVINAKMEEANKPRGMGALAGIRDDNCKFVDMKDQNRPFFSARDGSDPKGGGQGR